VVTGVPASVVERAVAVVTGAGAGIGRATAELFAERGYVVVAVDWRADALAWTAGRSDVLPVVGDVAEEATNEAMVAQAMSRFGRLDVSVLNAGIAGSPGLEAAGAMERLDRVLAVNVRGAALGIRHCAPAMRLGGGGSIVATASVAGLRADPGSWAYGASKAAVVNLVRAAAIDYATQHIRVNAVAPGPVETPMTSPIRDLPELHHAVAHRVPMQRWGQPHEVAEVIWFLASPAASFVTGVTIPVDGGIDAHNATFEIPARPDH
jgi:NAD(P)-dependent dehydrogenase (short-subunit alcohol dehydrogenase family)